MAGAEFVDGWFVAQVLGEGAYGEVRLLQHASGARVALKALRGDEGAREAALHAALRHPHVLRCLGHRAHADAHYLFLEWAAGGELFQRIEPDVGMCEAAARRHWRQLLAALGYLHARGVAHRDVKPENLLLAADGRLLLADFGLATVFRAGGRERRLARVAGTPPYAAPEVLRAAAAPYRAPPADLWSAAVVLLAMLVGELPWARAAADDERFARWAAGGAGGGDGPWRGGPWRRVPPPALALLLRALQPAPAGRATLQQLLDHPWTLQQPDAAPEEADDEAWRSQPAAPAVDAAAAAALWHSQPAAGRAPAAAPSSRLWLRCAEQGAGAALRAAAAARGWRRSGEALAAPGHVLAAPGAELRVWLQAVAPALTLLHVRRAGGCGLDFKRRFAELCADLAPLRAAEPPADLT